MIDGEVVVETLSTDQLQNEISTPELDESADNQFSLSSGSKPSLSGIQKPAPKISSIKKNITG